MYLTIGVIPDLMWVSGQPGQNTVLYVIVQCPALSLTPLLNTPTMTSRSIPTFNTRATISNGSLTRRALPVTHYGPNPRRILLSDFRNGNCSVTPVDGSTQITCDAKGGRSSRLGCLSTLMSYRLPSPRISSESNNNSWLYHTAHRPLDSTYL